MPSPLKSILYVEKKSKFYAYLYEVSSDKEFQAILKEQRRKYRKAVHHCWAYRIESDEGIQEASKDDGEVGHPGKAILELMRHWDLRNRAIIVSRVFGGVKLGVGGVTRAFRTAAEGLMESE